MTKHWKRNGKSFSLKWKTNIIDIDDDGVYYVRMFYVLYIMYEKKRFVESSIFFWTRSEKKNLRENLIFEMSEIITKKKFNPER